ncbi:hypothetical protein JOD54_002402 [Actinokineospora baliensis]|uniref:DUF742 domain-containing protein n=1 Tax=Actinokineospora baliensis TaxID=547056 RepID=UPI0027DDD69E|nr:DUF742 domain-containing protein [Actinokineospora baliensis]MBM7772198.1 hypothetical protein [Actinokineospora baliensis]
MRGVEVGRTGARFGPPGHWRGTDAEDAAEPGVAGADIGQVGARFGSRRRRGNAEPEPEPEVVVPEQAPALDELTDDEWVSRPQAHALVRPYAWTGGRTRARADLAVEALVSTVEVPRRASWEHRMITDLCLSPRSVAEVAALISVPLGVARVLITDLADRGVLTVHEVADDTPDLAFMSRVLSALRKL